MSLTIWWIRRDLRLSDNPALKAAIDNSAEVLPVFVVDPNLINSPFSGEKRMSFLWGGLKQLDTDLYKKGSHLVVRTGNPLEVLTKLRYQMEASMIYAEPDFSPYARTRDRKIAEVLPLKLVGCPALRHPHDILKSDGKPYIVFSAFMRSWKYSKSLTYGNLLSAPDLIITPQHVKSEGIPSGSVSSSALSFQPGEEMAQEQLIAFIKGDRPLMFDYRQQRDRIDIKGTSQLSPYLRFGMISARQAIAQARKSLSLRDGMHAYESFDAWLNELIWRDFFISILYHFPEVIRKSYRKAYNEFSWVNDEQDFDAWRYGQTGYPIIDAAMRQLFNTGWMHNRARMITASFLVKDLLIDWRWGQRWFMENLIDGDPAANNGGWQWVSGTGTDAVPYFRIFNPTLQSRKSDPYGKYIRTWVPELEKVPDKYIHEPWKMPLLLQKRIFCKIGVDYPAPVVDHAWARERVLEVYRRSAL